ncbi:recombinase family protein [Ornithinimicrobium cryptoxanthini]|uniref:Recombinase family protein n=1 Tax=Ornithinimicrobium cryptoxanthini TaxID=2934161 RepID=A0ABY4YEW9_9MICO|nr:recombinase family protein [Ornithinimicrobium cryptoxanthini]USQ75325.1 recombinase family protein [Ornithinimicrobium cryptoxanthini]
MTVPAGIYLRISRDSEGLGLGVKRQRVDCEKLVARMGWDLAQVYEDNDVSATRSKVRPAYTRMMQDVERGVIKAVAVWDVDRLTRTPRELEDVIDHADRLGLKLASVGGDIDLATEQGRMMARMKGTVARYEVEQQRRRLKAKHQELAANGAHIGKRPFGWDFRADRTLTINHEEAAVVRECVDRVLSGQALWKISNDLNSRGITTSSGRQWQTIVLRQMLLRWRNCGVRTHLGKEVGPGQWDPIIDMPTHERVVALLTDPARRTSNRGTEAKYLLTSLAHCGACGRSMVGTNEYSYVLRNGRTRTYAHSYTCPHAGCMKVRRRMADVDDLVTRVVLGVLERDGVQLLGGDPAAATHASDRIAALEAKLALAADQFADDTITSDQLRRVSERLKPQLAQERARLAAAQPSPELAGFAGTGVADAWETADVETRKRIIRFLAMRITINPIGSGNGSTFDPTSVAIEWPP